jgi:integrase
MWAFNGLLKFIQFQKERFNRKEITAGTIRNYVECQTILRDVRYCHKLGENYTRTAKRRRYTDDRAPTLEEIKKLCEYPDRRIKAIVYTMVSSGIRVGAWDYLHWENIRPIEQDGKIVAARMVVYDGEDDAYITFITQPAYHELAQWMKYREEAGSKEPLRISAAPPQMGL